MLGAQRKAFLLKILDRDGRVVAKSVAAELGISEDSIRRDLRELAEAGALIRVYGGALPVPPADRPMQERHGTHWHPTARTASRPRRSRRSTPA